MNNKELNDVNGGSWLVTEERAAALGITLRNEDGTPGEFGYLWNTGDYYLGDRKLDSNEVARLTDFYDAHGYAAKSVEEAFEWFRSLYM